eukprot:5717063-Pyramimonas_sp.AAC.1
MPNADIRPLLLPGTGSPAFSESSGTWRRRGGHIGRVGPSHPDQNFPSRLMQLLDSPGVRIPRSMHVSALTGRKVSPAVPSSLVTLAPLVT